MPCVFETELWACQPFVSVDFLLSALSVSLSYGVLDTHTSLLGNVVLLEDILFFCIFDNT